MARSEDIETNRDPYAPPRHRDRSGAVLRMALVAVLLGAAVWGYTQYESDGPGLIADALQEQSLADTSLDAMPPEPAPLGEPESAPGESAGSEQRPSPMPPSGR